MYILGYSGHAYVVLDAIYSNNIEVLGYFDKTEAKINPYHISYKGYEKDIVDFNQIIHPLFPAMGDNGIRKKLHMFIEEKNLLQTTVVNLSASISPKATLGQSSLVSAKATINSLVNIGKACIINTAAVVEHECFVGDYSHIAPGAILAGNVKIGQSCFIGAGAIVKQGVQIADNVTIGAGAVVLKNINEGEVWVGNPAKRLK